MSNGFLANNKMVLGFAGGTIALAVAAAFSVGLFVPESVNPAPEDQVVEGTPEDASSQTARAAQPAPPAPTWSDEGGFADDWNTASVASANGNSGWASGTPTTGANEIEFGTYDPSARQTGPAPAPSRGGGQGSGSRAGGGSGSGPTITSGAAPGAPNNPPPGSNR